MTRLLVREPHSLEEGFVYTFEEFDPSERDVVQDLRALRDALARMGVDVGLPSEDPHVVLPDGSIGHAEAQG